MTSRYDAFDHLVQSLFLERTDFMSLLSIYCDESGIDAKNRAAVVAGYVGQVSEWGKFAKEWRAILKKTLRS